MKLIKPSFEIWEQPAGLEGIYKQIELAGKVSHKSEHTIKEGSAKEFVDRMIKLGHGATLEFGTIYLYYKVDSPSAMIKEIINFYSNNKYSEVVRIDTHDDNYSECGMGRVYNIVYSEYFITTNLRVCIENNRQEYLTNALYKPTEHHKKRICVKFICDRSIANEFVRHRKFSFLQESTRYCNYSKDKFKKELTFIEPYWDYNDTPAEEYGFIDLLLDSEKAYFDAIERGWKPEQARAILPNALKTELVMTGFVSDWQHFFDLRALGTTGAPHPQAKELAEPLMKEFIARKYINN